MIVIDKILNDVLKSMGVDVNGKQPPHWIPQYYDTFVYAYMCSRCGKHSWSKNKSCDGCNSIMEEI